jgi:hypothetical protein
MLWDGRKASIPLAYFDLADCAFNDQFAVMPIVSFINDPVADDVGALTN